MRTQPDHAPLSPLCQRRLAVFLDIDGVLNSTTVSTPYFWPPYQAQVRQIAIVSNEVRADRCELLEPEKQALLADILLRHPHVVLVISSAWRNWSGYNFFDMTEEDYAGGPCPFGPPGHDHAWERDHVQSLRWLKLQLHPVLAGRIIGRTPCLGWDGTRLEEIRTWMREHARSMDLPPHWVAIDDQARHFEALEAGMFRDAGAIPSGPGGFPAEAVLLTDGEVGLTAGSAAALEAALQCASHGPGV
jgi:hypothetical protein